MDETVKCPYCGFEQEVCHDDGQNYNESGDENYCEECEKTFIIYTSCSYSYQTGCNENDHDIREIEIDRSNDILGKYRKTHKHIECLREHCEWSRLIPNEDMHQYLPDKYPKKEKS